VVGIVANYAAVASDTFSSELGILSRSQPRLITAPWRKVPHGTNGGVTLTGLSAGFLGSFIITLTSTLLIPFCSSTSKGAAAWSFSDKGLYIVALTLAGFTGTLLDSLLGSLFQASVVDVQSGKIVEGEGGRKALVHSSGSLHVKQQTKLQSLAGQSSALESSLFASKRAPAVGTSSKDPMKASHESRRVEVGLDILDNNAVNFLMAASVSVGSMVVACSLWDLPLSSVFFP